MTWCMRIPTWIPNATNTHTQVVYTNYFPTATMVARTLLNVTFYLYCLSCFSAYGISFGPLGVGNRAMRGFGFGWIDCFGGQGLYWVIFNFGTFSLFVMSVTILLFVFIYYLNSLRILQRDAEDVGELFIAFKSFIFIIDWSLSRQ